MAGRPGGAATGRADRRLRRNPAADRRRAGASLSAVLAGFGALALVIAIGWLVGRAKVLGDDAPGVLSRLSYFVATPALLLHTLADADPGVLASTTLIAIAGSAVLCGLLYVVVARWRWHQGPARLTIGVFASSYVNAGNLGIPISVYVLGDAAYVAPVLLFQVLVLSPIGLSILAGARPGQSRLRLLTQPLRTPIVLGCAVGLGLAATGWRLPTVVREPVELLAMLAVPAALLAY
ncbi:MAG: AEC family transporter, partial [Actinophytocola sp.]|uniref:AEC family transporter n=1 Tax=Actinophytocola sp. TaxID=1872138 RepID=UPI003D6AB437